MITSKRPLFSARHKFQDDVWGEIQLNELERDVIDTPEFQRLFRTSQLGFVDLVYPTANHTRGSHSIGSCKVAKRLMSRLKANGAPLRGKDGRYAQFTISKAENVLIGLGALLHDISHVPLSHDLEKKSHRFKVKTSHHPNGSAIKLRSFYGHYPKHDDYERNPLLFLLLLDSKRSVLARVLKYYSKPFLELLYSHESARGCPDHLRDFVTALKSSENEWDVSSEILPSLLFHLLVHEEPKDALADWRLRCTKTFDSSELSEWHLGPASHARALHYNWYQPYRHDIIGNTLSADLLDYLKRDCQRMGMKRRFDLQLLNYYVLVHDVGLNRLGPERDRAGLPDDPEPMMRLPRYRCAIDLRDHKRGTSRVETLNDVFRLLDLRHEIHEKAVMHRVVQSANAMMARSLMLLGNKPRLDQVVKFGEPGHALAGEDSLFTTLLALCENDRSGPQQGAATHDAMRILQKLAERRVYRPLMIVPGDRLADHLVPTAAMLGDDMSQHTLRTFAAVIDSPMYSPFLLFVCACAEKFLRGAFETDSDLCDYAKWIAEGSASVHDIHSAMNALPSRVIIWALPYKQLYKDPALVVKLDSWITRIDEAHSADPSARYIQDRISEAIRDADSKYATLWKLYVFISDGLYYMGSYHRLRNAVSQERTEEASLSEHCRRLRCVEGLMIAAFDAVWGDWTDFSKGSTTTAEEFKEQLERRMAAETFRAITGKWIADYKLRIARFRSSACDDGGSGATHPATLLSTVDIRHYVHAKSVFDAHCRDVRYKFSDVVTAESWKFISSQGSQEERAVIEVLGRVGIGANEMVASKLAVAEFQELVDAYQSDPVVRERCAEILGRGGAVEPDDLRVFWLSGLPWAPKDAIVEVTKGTNTVEFTPTSRSEWIAWIIEQSQGLEDHVQAELRRQREGILAVIERIGRDRWPDVARDMRARFFNEKMLLNNNVKAVQMINVLERRWGLASLGENDQAR